MQDRDHRFGPAPDLAAATVARYRDADCDRPGEGGLKPLSATGDELQATFSVSGEWPDLEVTFESGDGRGRNSNYKEGVEAVVQRLAGMDARLVGSRISSKDVVARAAAGGADPAFTPTGFELPVDLRNVDANRLRRALGHAGALVDSKPDSSGNTTRRMTLSVRLPGPPMAPEELEQILGSRNADGVTALTVTATGQARAPDTRSRQRLPADMLNKVSAEHVRRAVEALLAAPRDHAFGVSTDFDLVTDTGERLPPKAVFGLAATEALGFPVLPRHFTGGIGTPAFRRLEAAGFRIEPKPGAAESGKIATEPGEGVGILSMMTDLAEIDGAMEIWLEALEEGARAEEGGRRWLGPEAVMFSVHPSPRRHGVWDTELGVNSRGEPWTVQLNAPVAAADANGLTTVALDTAGRRYLIRQGWLRRNPDSDGDVKGARFRTLSGLTPVTVSGGTTPTPREWYVVADLDGPAAEVRRQTGLFVHACAQARLRSLGVELPPAAPPLMASDEKGGVFTRSAVEAQPEREVRRLQGEVWLALRAVLEQAGIRMIKLRHRAGYEVDGVILAPSSAILLEIKTGGSAADVYEGVGQLMLYAEMLGLTDHRRILLLPWRPGAALKAAAERCGYEVHDYELELTGEEVLVNFSKEFLAICGVQVPLQLASSRGIRRHCIRPCVRKTPTSD